MQMAMAVNMALMALTKIGIFCTEPFRVPMAGKITHILFDKTGTLTTDQLVPVGVINATSRQQAVSVSPATAAAESVGAGAVAAGTCVHMCIYHESKRVYVYIMRTYMYMCIS